MRLQNGSVLNWQIRLWFGLAMAFGTCLCARTAVGESGLLFRFRDDSTISAGVLLVPDPRLRFEPEIGFSVARSTLEEEFRFGETESSSTTFEAMLGVLYVLPSQGPFSATLGPRVGYSRVDTSFEVTALSGGYKSERGTNGWFASAALGAEVDVLSRASLGVEGAIVYRSDSGTSKQTSSPPGGPSGESGHSIATTSTQFSLVLRWYPWGER